MQAFDAAIAATGGKLPEIIVNNAAGTYQYSEVYRAVRVLMYYVVMNSLTPSDVYIFIIIECLY